MLDKLVKFLNDNSSVELIISGYTDNIGPAQFNLSLSKRRAQSVINYFTKNGIDKSRFEVKGYGSQKPIATNDTKEGRSKNRRVEFLIKK